MNTSLRYELTTKAEAYELLKLYQGVYPTLGWSDSRLNWQYYQNPAGDARVWVAKDEDRIIASYAAVPHKMYVKGQVATGWRVQDVMTRPEYRGMGIYNKLTGMAAQFLFSGQFPLNFSFPNESSHAGFIRSGWTDSRRIPLRVLPSLASMQLKDLSADISPIRSFDERTSQIWQSYRYGLDFAIDRSSTYLDWRYFASPRRNSYSTYKVTEAGEELVLILKYYEREDGSKWVHLCDIFYSEANPLLIEQAVRHWIHVALASECNSLSCWTQKGNGLDLVLDDYDFLRQESLNRWLVVSGEPSDWNAEQECDGHRWHMAMGDSDVF